MSSSVPAALHAELTEHTALLRALRTSNALNLTAHLIRPAENGNDTWTQWPLIDCPVPEWSLADEIQHLAESVVAQPDADSDSDLDDMSAADIVLHTGTLLVRILSLMADQRPSAPGSMQNRLWPMNWEDVIALLALCGVHSTVVARAETRLRRIYATKERSSAFSIANRLDAATAAKTRFSKLASVHEDQLFAPPILHPRTRRRDIEASLGRRRSMHARAKSQAVVDAGTDLEA